MSIESVNAKAKFRKFVDHTGVKFGRLTAKRLVGKKGKKTFWEFECDCGTLKEIPLYHVTSGKITSCKCLNREINTTHGKAKVNGKVTRTYAIWSQMKQRCHNTKNSRYSDYGARGISVHVWWHVFENFLADMGEAPDGLSIERRDNDGNYCPENCYWATGHEQNRNKRTNRWIEYNGEKKLVSEWERDLGVSSGTITHRLAAGWLIEAAVTTRAGL